MKLFHPKHLLFVTSIASVIATDNYTQPSPISNDYDMRDISNSNVVMERSYMRGLQQRSDDVVMILSLVDATSNDIIERIYDHSTVEVESHVERFNVEAVVQSSGSTSIKYVKFYGFNKHKESIAPYAMCGNFGANFIECPGMVQGGSYWVSASAYSSNAAIIGRVAATFTISTPEAITPRIGIRTTNRPSSNPTYEPTANPTSRALTFGPTENPATHSPTFVAPTENDCGIPKLYNQWTKEYSKLPHSVAESQGALVGNDFLIVSGFSGDWSRCTDQVYSLDTLNPSKGWRQRDPLPGYLSQGITHGAFTVVDQKFYLCGGYYGGNPGQALPDCIAFDNEQPPGRQWSSIASLPSDRAGGALLYDEERNALVFASGAYRPVEGERLAVDTHNVWLYNFDSPSKGWRIRAAVPLASNHISYVSAKGRDGRPRHYVMGGQLGENEKNGNMDAMYEWISSSQSWSQRADMLIPRGHASSSTLSYTKSCGFVVIAGAINYGKTSDISHYNVETDTWTKLGDLDRKINTPVCVIVTDGDEDRILCESGLIRGSYSAQRVIGVE